MRFSSEFQEQLQYDKQKDLIGSGGTAYVVKASYFGIDVAVKVFDAAVDQTELSNEGTAHGLISQLPSWLPFVTPILLNSLELH